MSMHFTEVLLDGANNGIAAFICSKNEWVKRTDSKSNLFPNFESLEAKILRSGYDYHDISFSFIIHDKVTGKATISLNEAIKTDEGWKVSRQETIYGQPFLHIYNIVETKATQICNIGYITTKDSNTHDPNKDPKYEYVKLRKLYGMAIEAAKTMVQYQYFGLAMKKTRFGIDLSISGTTATIHIWKNGKLMDYNTEIKKIREANKHFQIRCLPFLPGQDKYGSLYVFTTCQECDYNDNFVRVKIDQLEEEYMLYLQDMYPDDDAKYIPCEFQGKVNLSEEVINNDHNTENRSK